MINSPIKNIPVSPIPLSEQLRVKLSNLSYLAFAMCIARVLRHLGYTDVPIPSRKSFKGPNAIGGIDLTAQKRSSFGMSRIAIQLKQYRGPRPVSRRAVDEFRGVILRKGYPEGLLFTTLSFSADAIKAAIGYPGRPLYLIDGTELGCLAESCRLGLIEREDPASNSKFFELDEEWFEGLERDCDALRRDSNNRGAADV